MKVSQFETVVCETYIPEELEEGKIYVSQKYNVVIHNCACGCGWKTITPVNTAHGWGLFIDQNRVTLHPSIGNMQYPCKSHYFIKNGEVQWC